jgi:3-deoxy-D-manno-octulosonic-acid transferase
LFFQFYGHWFLQALSWFDQIFTQNQASEDLLHRYGIRKTTVAGDTRIDRVMRIAAEAKDYPEVQAFCGQSPTLIAGSTWPGDEDLLAEWLPQMPADWKLIIAPHEIGEEHLVAVEKKLEILSVLRYSQWNPAAATAAQVLLIDNIGMLAALYRYGKLAYIGGGFGSGIHNILEPMAFGLPAAFGPKFQKFNEAVTLAKQGGGFSVKNAAEFGIVFEAMLNEKKHQDTVQIVQVYLNVNRGATDRILERIWLTFGSILMPKNGKFA